MNNAARAVSKNANYPPNNEDDGDDIEYITHVEIFLNCER